MHLVFPFFLFSHLSYFFLIFLTFHLLSSYLFSFFITILHLFPHPYLLFSSPFSLASSDLLQAAVYELGSKQVSFPLLASTPPILRSLSYSTVSHRSITVRTLLVLFLLPVPHKIRFVPLTALALLTFPRSIQ
ncbi:hypothetical protein E2C01_065952 [Portunus trituberculatus]|uniref:Uncharacterized protein n=1 Tax=Portunus trituberculatus TaxID=210409 RepID=A0A5B7HR25_PORTR|nr:hypothetical protein [Portunus trituberculatus]